MPATARLPVTGLADRSRCRGQRHLCRTSAVVAVLVLTTLAVTADGHAQDLAAAEVAPAAPPADAEPRWRVVGELEMGAAAIGGTLGGDLDGVFMMRIGGSVEHRRISLALDGGFGLVESRKPERDDSSLLVLGLGAAIGYRVPLSPHLHLVPRLGLRTDWLKGSHDVRRTCDQTGACDGGFYPEVPSYRSSGPAAALRLELVMPGDRGAEIACALALSLSWQRLRVDLPGAGRTSGSLILLALGGALGAAR